MVVFMPLFFEIARERQVRIIFEIWNNILLYQCVLICVPDNVYFGFFSFSFLVLILFQLLETERSLVKDMRSQGFSDRQLQELGFSSTAIHEPSVASLNTKK